MRDHIHTYATQPHYQHHITNTTQHHNTTPTNPQTTKPTTTPTITASRSDAANLADAGWSNIVLIEHGSGQSYVHGDGVSVDASNDRGVNPAVTHWVGPNRFAWDVVADRLPNATPWFVSAHVWSLAARRGMVDPDVTELGVPTIGFAVHWPNPACPESRGGWPATGGLVGALKRARPDWRVVLLPHPKLNGGSIRRHPKVRPHPDVIIDSDWPEWSRHVDVVVADNTSIMWEAAALGVPVVGFRPPHWREWERMPEHGLRFPGHNHIRLPSDHTRPRDIVDAVITAAERGVDDTDAGLSRHVRDVVYPTLDETPERLDAMWGAIIGE